MNSLSAPALIPPFIIIILSLILKHVIPSSITGLTASIICFILGGFAASLLTRQTLFYTIETMSGIKISDCLHKYIYYACWIAFLILIFYLDKILRA